MVDSRKEQPVANEHFRAMGYTVPHQILALVESGEAKDLSWHNDACPSYGLVIDDAVTLAIFVEHANKNRRGDRIKTDLRFLLALYSVDKTRLPQYPEGDLCATNDPALAVKAFRAVTLEIKEKLDAGKPKTCEACNVALTPDLQCPQCGVSHTAAPCATCGRVGLHKDDCTEPPGHDTEGGPAYVPPRVSEARLKELVATFERAYQYYMGWGFAFEHPGIFTYYQLGGDLRVCFTPDWTEPGQVDVQVHAAGGDALDDQGGDHDFTKDQSAPALFGIVKPYLDRLAGKSVKDFIK